MRDARPSRRASARKGPRGLAKASQEPYGVSTVTDFGEQAGDRSKRNRDEARPGAQPPSIPGAATRPARTGTAASLFPRNKRRLGTHASRRPVDAPPARGGVGHPPPHPAAGSPRGPAAAGSPRSGAAPARAGPGGPGGATPAKKAEAPSRDMREGASTRKRPLLGGGVLLSHGLIRSTIGARGLNFRVRDGTGCASPAMAAGQQGAFSAGASHPCPGGRTALQAAPPGEGIAEACTLAAPSRNKEGHGGEEELGRLVALG